MVEIIDGVESIVMSLGGLKAASRGALLGLEPAQVYQLRTDARKNNDAVKKGIASPLSDRPAPAVTAGSSPESRESKTLTVEGYKQRKAGIDGQFKPKEHWFNKTFEKEGMQSGTTRKFGNSHYGGGWDSAPLAASKPSFYYGSRKGMTGTPAKRFQRVTMEQARDPSNPHKIGYTVNVYTAGNKNMKGASTGGNNSRFVSTKQEADSMFARTSKNIESENKSLQKSAQRERRGKAPIEQTGSLRGYRSPFD